MNNLVTDTGKVQFRPLGDRVFVKRIPELESSLIIIPEAYKSPSKHAEVIAVGTQCYDLEIGDVVVLPGIAAKYPDWEDCDYMMIRQDDIGGILTD